MDVAVYSPTGSGNVHTDKVISGGRRTGVAPKGMGFKAAAAKVAKKGKMPMKQAQAVIAAGARKASPAAKKANPNLEKVIGKNKAAKKGVSASSARSRGQAAMASKRTAAKGK